MTIDLNNYFPYILIEHIINYLPLFDIINFWNCNKYIYRIKSNIEDIISNKYYFNNFKSLCEYYKYNIKIRRKIDVKDTLNDWLEGTIIAHQVHKGVIIIKVKYTGYSSRWNEWMRVDNLRVSGHGTKCYNGLNEPNVGNKILYNIFGHWKECIIKNFNHNKTKITLEYNRKYRTVPDVHSSTIVTVLYDINSNIAPVSKRGILLED